MNMYFGNLVACATTLTVLLELTFIIITVKNQKKITNWGRRVAVLALFGLLICCFAATRDNYHLSVQASFDSSVKAGLFTISSIQSTVCSILGGVNLLSSLSCVFVKNQKYRKIVFYIISVSFVIKTLVIEISRWL